MPPRRRPCLAVALCTLLAAGACLAQADPAPEIERAWRAGERAQAMQRLEQALAATPRDAPLRFLKAVLLADAGDRTAAIAVYQQLTQDYPELPEPYNNLGVLYAAAGELDKARDALETALRNDPSYAVAQENLGDLYVRLAARAYERSGTASLELQRKLQLARQLLARAPR